MQSCDSGLVRGGGVNNGGNGGGGSGVERDTSLVGQLKQKQCKAVWKYNEGSNGIRLNVPDSGQNRWLASKSLC